MDRPDPKTTDHALAHLGVGDFFPRPSGGEIPAAANDNPDLQEDDVKQDEKDGKDKDAADRDEPGAADTSASVVINQAAASDRAIELPLQRLPAADKDAPTDVVGIRLAAASAAPGAATNDRPAAGSADLGNLGASMSIRLSQEVDEDLADVWDMGGEGPAAPVAPAPKPVAQKPAPPPSKQTKPLETMAAASAAPPAPPPAPAPEEPTAVPVAANDVHLPEPAAPAADAPPSGGLSADSVVPVAPSPATPGAAGAPTERERRPAKPIFDDLMAPEFDEARARATRSDGGYVVSNDRLWEFLMDLDVKLSNFPPSGELEPDEKIRLRGKCRMVVMELFARGEVLRYFDGGLQENSWQLQIEDVRAAANRAPEQALQEQDKARKEALLATHTRAMAWLDDKKEVGGRHTKAARPFTKEGRTPTGGHPVLAPAAHPVHPAGGLPGGQTGTAAPAARTMDTPAPAAVPAPPPMAARPAEPAPGIHGAGTPPPPPAAPAPPPPAGPALPPAQDPLVVKAQGQAGPPPPQTAGPAPNPAKGKADAPHPLREKVRRHRVAIVAGLAMLIIGIAAGVTALMQERGKMPLLASAPSTVPTAEKSVSEPPQASAGTRKLFPMAPCELVDANKSSFDCSKGKGTSRKIRGTDIWELCGCERWQ